MAAHIRRLTIGNHFQELGNLQKLCIFLIVEPAGAQQQVSRLQKAADRAVVEEDYSAEISAQFRQVFNEQFVSILVQLSAVVSREHTVELAI